MSDPMTTSSEAHDHGHGDAQAAFRGVTRDVTAVSFSQTPKWWYGAFGLSLLMLGCLVIACAHLFATGIGIWGNNNVQGWAWDITNFVFWIGIGHAGTLISAVLYLF